MMKQTWVQDMQYQGFDRIPAESGSREWNFGEGQNGLIMSFIPAYQGKWHCKSMVRAASRAWWFWTTC